MSSERCAVCRLPADRRVDLESAYSIALGSDDVAGEVLAVAELFNVSRAALQRHRDHAKIAAKARRAPPVLEPQQEVVEEPEVAAPAPVDTAVPDMGGGLPDPAGGGTVVERARELLAYLAVPGRTSDQLAQAREIRHALTLEARIVGAMATKASFEAHPDFAPWLDALVDALAPVPGALDALSSYLNQASIAPARKAA